MKRSIITLILFLLTCGTAFAGEAITSAISLTDHKVGYAAITIFVIAYLFLIFEEQVKMRKSKSKSKPKLLVVGVIWLLIAMVY